MGCVCCSLGSIVSIILDALERISLCTVCAMLTCCLLFTILMVLVIGIGVGYHYCFVANSVEAMANAAKSAASLRSGREQPKLPVMRSVDKIVNGGIAHQLSKREVDPLKNHNYTTDFTFQNWTVYDSKLFMRNYTAYNFTS